MIDVINDDMLVISVKRHTSVSAIDGGDTVLIMLEGASSEIVSLLIPHQAAQELAIAISHHAERAPGHSFSE